ncbi:hypothetical protein ACWC4A_52925 [Streptomyces mirabilis]
MTMNTQEMSPQVQQTVETCKATHLASEEYLTHLKTLTGLPDTLLTSVRDCSDLTQLTANMLTRRSEMRVAVARTCADVCRQAAEASRQVNDNSGALYADQFLQCAEMCGILNPDS